MSVNPLVLTIPSTPDATTVAQVSSGVRLVIALLMGAGITIPIASDQVSSLVSALLEVASVGGALATYGWAWWKNRQAAAHVHATAVASAAAGTPVQPVTSK